MSQDVSETVALYESGLTGAQVGERLGITATAVYKRLLRANVECRPRGYRTSLFTESQIAEIVHRYENGESSRALAADFRVSKPSILRALRTRGVPRRPARRPLGPNARYRKIFIQPDDPLAPMAGTTGYTMLHRYVLARYIGRPLLPSESVHHLNGDKLDNRPENLELRQGNHGHGQCYECADCGSRSLVPIGLS